MLQAQSQLLYRQPQLQDNHDYENEKSTLIRVICDEKSLSLHIAKLKTIKFTLYNGKEIQKNHRHIGTSVCERH